MLRKFGQVLGPYCWKYCQTVHRCNIWRSTASRISSGKSCIYPEQSRRLVSWAPISPIPLPFVSFQLTSECTRVASTLSRSQPRRTQVVIICLVRVNPWRLWRSSNYLSFVKVVRALISLGAKPGSPLHELVFRSSYSPALLHLDTTLRRFGCEPF